MRHFAVATRLQHHGSVTATGCLFRGDVCSVLHRQHACCGAAQANLAVRPKFREPVRSPARMAFLKFG
jgi:hypothetical protein